MEVLGGLLAVPGGECAPAASAGLSAGGVYAKGPGFMQPETLAPSGAFWRKRAATLSCAWHNW